MKVRRRKENIKEISLRLYKNDKGTIGKEDPNCLL